MFEEWVGDGCHALVLAVVLLHIGFLSGQTLVIDEEVVAARGLVAAGSGLLLGEEAHGEGVLAEADVRRQGEHGLQVGRPLLWQRLRVVIHHGCLVVELAGEMVTADVLPSQVVDDDIHLHPFPGFLVPEAGVEVGQADGLLRQAAHIDDELHAEGAEVVHRVPSLAAPEVGVDEEVLAVALSHCA